MQPPQRSRGENIGAGLRQHFNPMVNAWYQLRVPVVVAVNGVAAGAGVSLALAGDIVLAARSATFLQLFAPKLGLMPGSRQHLLSAAAGRHGTREGPGTARRCIDGGGCRRLGTHLGLRRGRRVTAHARSPSRGASRPAPPKPSTHQSGIQHRAAAHASGTDGARGRTPGCPRRHQGFCRRRSGVSRQAGAEFQRRVIFATGTLTSAAAECGAAADSVPQLSQPPHAPGGFTIAAAASRRATRPSLRYAGARSAKRLIAASNRTRNVLGPSDETA